MARGSLRRLAPAWLIVSARRNGDTATACNLLEAFKSEVVAQSGNALTVDQAVELLRAADGVKAALRCV